MMKTLLATLVLGLVPTLALAGPGCSGSHEKTTAMTCTEGQTLDPETGLCIDLSTS